jgi:hypothetical protein
MVAVMAWPSREDLERRLHAFIADQLDDLEQRHPDGFDLGVYVAMSEIRLPLEDRGHLLREHVGYTRSRWRMWSTEDQGFVTPALIREAHEYFEFEASQDYDGYDAEFEDEDFWDDEEEVDDSDAVDNSGRDE